MVALTETMPKIACSTGCPLVSSQKSEINSSKKNHGVLEHSIPFSHYSSTTFFFFLPSFYCGNHFISQRYFIYQEDDLRGRSICTVHLLELR